MISQPILIRRSFSTSRSLARFHFDSHHFVRRLEREGLNRRQAEGIMAAMADVIDESINNMTADMVTKSQHEQHHYAQQVDFAHIKSDLQIMERNDLAQIKSENDVVIMDVNKLWQRLKEDITKTRIGVRGELKTDNGRLLEANADLELKIFQVESRIGQEIGGLRAAIQSSKATTLQYLVGFVTGSSALLLAYMRFK